MKKWKISHEKKEKKCKIYNKHLEKRHTWVHQNQGRLSVWISCFCLHKSGLWISMAIDLAMNKSRLEWTIRHSYPAGVIRIVSRTQCLIPLFDKNKLTHQSKSMCIYNFTCICGARYIGRTTRQLSKCIKEHHPAALSKRTVKSISSSILQHLVGSCHQVNPN